MSDWIDRMEARIALRRDRDLARRLRNGPLPYQSAEVLDAVPDVRRIADELRAEGEVEAADRLVTIIDGVETTLKDLWEAINEAEKTDD